MSTRGIVCSECGGTRWKVNRTAQRINRLTRHRKCLKCGHRIETEEREKQSAYMRVETTENRLPVTQLRNNESEGHNATRIAS